jgi:hypothetical protein
MSIAKNQQNLVNILFFYSMHKSSLGACFEHSKFFKVTQTDTQRRATCCICKTHGQTSQKKKTDQCCHHSHFPQIDGCGKFVAVSVRKVAVKGPKRLKCGRRKLFYKFIVKSDRKNDNSIARCSSLRPFP